MHIFFAADNRSRLCTKTTVLTFKNIQKMSKKETKISNEEMMELMGLKRTSNSDDDSDKTVIDLAIEKYSREELAAKEAEQPNEPTTDDVIPNDTEESTKVENAEQQPSVPSIQRRVSSKQRKLSLEEYRNTFMRPYKIEDRKPVFISGKLRKMLDKFACKIGEDRMSMSGLLENIVRHHIELYSEDFEHWKGM